MDAKMRDRFQHRLSPQLFSSDEGPETGDESDEDIVRSYLPGEGLGGGYIGDTNHNIPAINITLHSPSTNHVLEAEICQLADIQDSIQRMREGDLCPPLQDRQSVEARLSSSCPSLIVESGDEAGLPGDQAQAPGVTGGQLSPCVQHRRDQHRAHGAGRPGGRQRPGRARSPSVSTGESDEDTTVSDTSAPHRQPRHHQLSMGVAPGPGGGAGLHKSVSTPSMVAANENIGHSATPGGKQGKRPRVPEPTHVFIQKLIAEHGWSNQRSGTDSETEGEDGGGVSGGPLVQDNGLSLAAGPPRDLSAPRPQPGNTGSVPSPQLTLAEFLQKDLFSPNLSEEERRKQRRNKKERGGSLFSLRKKKDKKDGKGLAKAGSAVSLQGSRTVSGPRMPQHSYSMSSLKRYPGPGHPGPPGNANSGSSQFYLARSESSSPQTKEGSGWFSPGWSSPSHWAGGRGSGRSSPKPLLSPKLGGASGHGKWGQTSRWRRVGKKLGVIKSTEDREEVDGDRENLLDTELLPAEDFPPDFPISLRNLDTDPALRIQRDEAETWAASVPEGVASALKQHEAKRQEHIYEFIITEKHHCQLLKVIQKVFCEGMTTYLDMKPELLDRLFPQLDTLISIHFDFLRQLRERQDSTAVIPTIADILMNQFGREENAVRWKAAYGAFCSQHSDAVSIYKDILKTDRRFQEFVQQCSNNPLLRKMGIPECILTVTTRITKYPLLIEPLIKTAKERPEEQQRLRNCLHLVKSILVDVNGQVAEKERAQRLLEIYTKMDTRSHVTHDGKKFKKSDILSENRKLLFEGVGNLLSPALVPANSGGKGNRSPAPSVLVNILVLSDVMIFLQENNQKYNFVTPEGKTGVVPVHTLIAREKPGSDNKALYLISTSDREPEMYEVQVVQPRDRQDWIGGVRRAVDLSAGGPGEDGQFETEAERARKQLEAKYMKMRQLTSELRGKDMELARLLEDKMRILAEMLDELGVEQPLAPGVTKYTHLVQEKEPGQGPPGGNVTKEELIRQVTEAAKLASSLYSSGTGLGRSVSSVGEHQSEGYESPSLPRRAETFGGFDNGSGPGAASTSSASDTNGELKKGRDAVVSNSLALPGLPPIAPPLLAIDKSEQSAAVHMTHYLNNIMCMVSEHFTSLESIKVELSECKEKATFGYGRYKHNQQLEELRNLQEQLTSERRHWEQVKEEQERDMLEKSEQMTKMAAALEQEKRDVEEQRNKLYRKLETLQAQGFEIGTNMTVIGGGPNLQPTNSEPAFVMEVRKAVSPPGPDTRKLTQSGSVPVGAINENVRKPSHLPPQVSSNSNLKKLSETRASNSHLLSATNESKGDKGESVKQQIPLALAKLSMGGSKSRDKKSSSKLLHGERPSISAPIITSNHPPQLQSQYSSQLHQQQQHPPSQQQQQHYAQKSSQMLPFKLSETDRKNSSQSPKAGYQKLSSNSFAAAEERVSRSNLREPEHVNHARTGSSPASMIGRPMSNTLPKNSGRNGSPDKNDNNKPLKEIQKVNYAETGEEVFFF